MTDWKHHLLFGFIFVGMFSYLYMKYWQNNFLPLTTWSVLVTISIVLIYSLLPDVDADSSIINKFVNSVLVVVAIILIISKIYWAAILSVVMIFILEWVKHRGFFHSVITGVFLSAGLYFLHPFYAIVALIAYTGHLLMDD